jgi:hypothetical protein
MSSDQLVIVVSLQCHLRYVKDPRFKGSFVRIGGFYSFIFTGILFLQARERRLDGASIYTREKPQLAK